MLIITAFVLASVLPVHSHPLTHQAQPIGGEDDCAAFAESFQSVGIAPALLDVDYVLKPLPETMRTLEAGYDPSCRVSGVADIYTQCFVEGADREITLIREAPVVWTDPERFTVALISAENHESLRGFDLVWARCDDGA